MKDNMKKIYLFLLAAAGILAVASCAREQLIDPSGEETSEVTTLTFSFGETKTALVGGKTTWETGDKIRVYTSNAGFYRDVEVPAEAVGQSSFSADVNIKDTLYYAVYPIEACTGVSGGKVNVKLPTNPDGRFASANICAAATKGSEFKFHNATAVLKINVNSGNVVEILQINAKNTLVANLAIGFDVAADTLDITTSSPSKSATVAVGGIDGDYYIPVIPGTYEKDFAITALRGNGGYQTLKTTADNVVKLNDLLDLGTIGGSLTKGLEGKGTESEPFVITNLGEWTAFSASVNLGKDYADEFVDLQTDITEPVTAPVGYYITSDEQFPFAGTFKGNDHTIKLNLDGENCKTQNYVALFGVLDPGATVTNLKLEGTVKATGNYTSALAGWACGASTAKVTIKNITSSATVTTDGHSASSVVSYSYYTDIDNCVNSGKITSNATAATAMYCVPIAVFALDALASNSTYTNGVGGIAGYAQNTTLTNCSNSGEVTGFVKVGGIAGHTYWTPVSNATNTGVVTANGALNLRADSQQGFQWGSAAGGIVGCLTASGNISDCTNNADIAGKGGIGGIVGNVISVNNSASKPIVQRCVNNNKVTSTGVYYGGTQWVANPGTGGIVGNMVGYSTYTPSVLDCVNKGEVSAQSNGDLNGAHSVGGIVGLSYGGRNTLTGELIINRCVNQAKVTGGFWVGGILGLSASRYATQTSVLNCSNTGEILAEGYNSKNALIGVGGLVGGCNAWYTSYRTKSHLKVNNSYNHGDVKYSYESYGKPYAGGLIGDVWGNSSTLVQNDYAVCYVGTASQAAPASGADAYIGQLAGRQNGNYVHYCYYPAGTNPVGSNGTAANATTVVDFDATGNLSAPVTANSIACTTLLQVLNEWQNYYVKNGYFNWTGAVEKPVHDSTQD